MTNDKRKSSENGRILIAEDSRTQAEHLRYMLEEQGYAVDVAHNGKLALAQARATPPDLIISDVMMPGMNGYELCRTLKSDAQLKDIPIILVTSMSSPRNVIEGLNSGADNFITKPYDEKYLLARIGYLLTNRMLRSKGGMRTGIEIDLDGQRHFITAERQQILDLLISTYATGVRLSEDVRARERQLQESYETTKILYQSAEALNQAKSEIEVVHEAIARCDDIPFVNGSWLWLSTEAGETRTVQSIRLAPQLVEALSAPGDCSCWNDLISGKLTRAANVSPCARFARDQAASAEVSGHASVPLIGRWRPLGVLNAICKEQRPFSNEELQILSVVGNQLTAALDRAQLYDEMERMVAKRTAQLRAEIAERESAEAALRETMARLERAIRGSSAGLWEWRIDDGKAYFSPRFMALLGYDEAELRDDIDFFVSRIHPDDRDRVMEGAQSHFAQGTPYAYEFRLKMKSGDYLWCSAIGEATKDQSGQSVIMAGSISDVTRRRAAEEQLQQAQKMEAIGNLTGGIAHDFNNMLAVIIGNLDLLRDQLTLNSEASELTQAALSASLRGSELTKSLLAFARKQPLQPKLVNINELVRHSTRLLDRTLGGNIQLDLHLREDLWPVYADAAQIEAALFNLAINARDAMPDGGKIIVSASNASLDRNYAALNPDVTPGEFAALMVSDTGHGMSPEVLRRVFEPFFTTKDPGKGTGLGLAMVFGFAKQSGGHVKIYSEVGHGTTVKLYLPRASAAGDGIQEPSAAAPMLSTPDENILVVEDDPMVRQIVVKQLGEIGYRVIEADSAAAAIGHLKRDGTIDLVFSDVVMPGGMTGSDLVVEIRRQWPKVKVLLTSGFPQGLLETGGKLPAGVALLSKPYRKDDLARKLREILGL